MVKKIGVWIFAIATFFFLDDISAETKPEPTAPSYLCQPLTRKPEMDGIIKNDPAWNGIPSRGPFIILGEGNTRAEKQSSFKIGYTSDALYIAVICEEPDMKLQQRNFKDGNLVWFCDRIEIFLQPDRERAWYRHLVISPWGEKFTETISAPEIGGRKLDVNDWWHVKTCRGTDFWSAEIEIPYSLLWEFPSKNTVWHGNIKRITYTGYKVPILSSWTYFATNNHEPKNFGKFCFAQDLDFSKHSECPAEDSGRKYIKTRIRDNLNLIEDVSIYLEKGQYENDSEKHQSLASFAILKKEIMHLPGINNLDSLSMSELLYIMNKTDTASKTAEEFKQVFLKKELFRAYP